MMPIPPRFTLIAATALPLAGCASNQLAADLRSALEPCCAQHFHDKSSLARCLNERERPVWAKEDPGTRDLSSTA